ncbi:MAG: hypothetical protein AAGG69_05435 [Pseudomonadota bacterium]
MKKLRLALSILATTTFATSVNASDITTPEGFMEWRTPEAVTVAAPLAILGDRYTNFPGGEEEGRPELSINVRIINAFFPEQKRFIVDAVETGYADDSVGGGWERFMLKPTEGGQYELVAHGWKWRCQRGDMAQQWVGRTCP